MADLGILERVDLREKWQNEALEFTPWLKDNLDKLGDAIRMEIDTEGIETEVRVGKYTADLICRDANDSSQIVIENQFGDTDHDHLGKLLTYASALDSDPPVRSVIWISESFNDEHRSTLDWLNRISHEEIRFFGITVELLRIDGSRAAARFNLVASPNDWTKAVRASSGKVSEAERQYQQFWTALGKQLPVDVPQLKARSPQPRAYFNIAIGRSDFALHCTLSEQKKQLGVALEIRGENSKHYFNQLEIEKNAIEEEIGSTLEWRHTKGQACKITMVKLGDPTDESSRAGQIKWMTQTLDKFDNAFRDRVRALAVED